MSRHLIVTRGIGQKLLKLNPLRGSARGPLASPVWLRAHCPRLREDYPLAVALYASAVSLNAREECGETVTANSARLSFRSHAVLTSAQCNVRHTIVLLVLTWTRLWIRVNRIHQPKE